MNVLLTGSAGFVGRHFAAKLAASGADITRVDIADPDEPHDARDWFRHNDDHYDLVIHLAAVVGGRATIDGDPLALAVNLAIDAELFRWAARTCPGKIVYFSSSAAYPTALQTAAASRRRLVEDDICLNHVDTPDAIYGWAKLTGEVLAAKARQAAGLDVLVVRPFSGYGTDQDAAYPFPAFIARARRDGPFEVWGDGRQVRDWIHIGDIVDAVLTAVALDVPGPLNLGSGIPVAFDDLARQVMSAAGNVRRIEHVLGRPSGVHYRVADPSMMLVFYTPKISLNDGIRMALNAAKVPA